MFGMVLKWLTGGGIAAIGKEINDWQKIKLEAKNNSERIQAELAIERLREQRAVQMEGGHWLPRLVRALMMIPVIWYWGKIIVWDKILELGVTDNLTDTQWYIVGTMVGFYFLSEFKFLRRG